MNWSGYQENVFDFVINGEGNAFVEAVAGSGKTATIEEAAKRVPQEQTVLALAFNRSIKLELEKRLENQFNVDVLTLNGLGYKVVRENVRGRVKVDGDAVAKILKYEVIRTNKSSYKLPKDEFMLWVKTQRAISRIISLFKANMVFDLATASSLIGQYMEAQGIERPDVDNFVDLLLATYKLALTKTTFIDFDDQIALPLLHDWRIPQYDFVFVDEAQDLSYAQIELVRRVGGRAVFVGDPAQSIYQFRGASSEAVDFIGREFDCCKLPLSVCYRCATAIVKEAQEFVPQIEPYNGAEEGTVEIIDLGDFRAMAKDKDVVLCRCTAPLVEECLVFIRQGRKAFVKGKDLGEDVKELIKSLGKIHDLDDLFDRINEAKGKASKIKNPNKRLAATDKLDTLFFLAEDCDDLLELDCKIDAVFCKSGKGIIFMTIHKSKGLEADRVFIIRRDLIPHPMSVDREAENNLAYVAITRAKRELYYVEKV